MKKFLIFLNISLIFFSVTTLASPPSKSSKTLSDNDIFDLCPQLYMDSSAEPGSINDCKKVWDYYTQTKNYCGIALMAFNGLGGQKANLQQAMSYARRQINDEDKLPSGQEPGCSRDNLLQYLQNTKSATDNNDYLTYVDLRSGVDVGHNINLINYQHDLDFKIRHDKLLVDAQAAKLPQAQAKALQKVWQNFLVLVNGIEDVAPIKNCGSIGTLDGLDVTNPIQTNMLMDFSFYMLDVLEPSKNACDKECQDFLKENNLDYSFYILDPKMPQTKLENLIKDYDKKLNETYHQLLKKRNSADDITTVQTDYSSTINPLIKFERDWIRYKDAYLAFADIYFANKDNKNLLKQAIIADLTKRQLDLLSDWLDTINDKCAGDDVSSTE